MRASRERRLTTRQDAASPKSWELPFPLFGGAASSRASGAPGGGVAEVDGEVAQGAAGVDGLRGGGGGDGFGEGGKAFAEVAGVGRGGFDFAGMEASGVFEEKIHFDGAFGVAVEPHVGVESAVETGFAGFGDAQVLEEAADWRKPTEVYRFIQEKSNNARNCNEMNMDGVYFPGRKEVA